MQDAAVEQAVVEEVAGRVMRLDAAQRRAGADCREVVRNPTVTPHVHRDAPVGPLRPRLLIDVLEEGVTVVLVKFVEQISDECPFVTKWRSADVLDDQVVRRVGRPDGLEHLRGNPTSCLASAQDEHRPPRVVLQVDVGH
jgi:hypothetical protein